MKTTGFLLLGLMLFFYSGIAAANIPVDCRGYPRKPCTKELNRHCASDGRTYDNKCLFCNAYVASGGRLALLYYGKCVK